MSRPDWRDMPRDAFQADADTVQGALFGAPAPCGTGDLLAELEEMSE